MSTIASNNIRHMQIELGLITMKDVYTCRYTKTCSQVGVVIHHWAWLLPCIVPQQRAIQCLQIQKCFCVALIGNLKSMLLMGYIQIAALFPPPPPPPPTHTHTHTHTHIICWPEVYQRPCRRYHKLSIYAWPLLGQTLVYLIQSCIQKTLTPHARTNHIYTGVRTYPKPLPV